MNSEPWQPTASALTSGTLQYSLPTLLVGIVPVAALCAVGFYVGWVIAVAILGAVAICGIIGAGGARGRRWFLRGAACGFHLSLLATLLTTVHCFYKEHVREEVLGWRPTPSPMRCSPAEMLQAIQSVVPYARGLPQGASAEDLLCGRYIRLAGAEIYVFPDKTYVYVERADTGTETVLDQGTWDYRDGVAFMHTDGCIPEHIRRPHDRYVPLMAISQGLFGPSTTKEGVFLLRADRSTELRLDAAIGRGEEDFLSGHSFLQTEKISIGETQATKNWVYASCAPAMSQRLTTATSYAIAIARRVGTS